jgi:hypothetical protein
MTSICGDTGEFATFLMFAMFTMCAVLLLCSTWKVLRRNDQLIQEYDLELRELRARRERRGEGTRGARREN